MNDKNIFDIAAKVVFMPYGENIRRNILQEWRIADSGSDVIKGEYESGIRVNYGNFETTLSNEDFRKKVFVQMCEPKFALDNIVKDVNGEVKKVLSIFFRQTIKLSFYSSRYNSISRDDYDIVASAPYDTISKGQWLTLPLETDKGFSSREVIGNINFNPATLQYKLNINEWCLRELNERQQENLRYEKQCGIGNLIESKCQDYIIIFDTKYSVDWFYKLRLVEETNDYEVYNRQVRLRNRSTDRRIVFSYEDDYKMWVVDNSNVNKQELGELKDFLKSNSADFDYILSTEPKRETFLISTKLK